MEIYTEFLTSFEFFMGLITLIIVIFYVRFKINRFSKEVLKEIRNQQVVLFKQDLPSIDKPIAIKTKKEEVVIIKLLCSDKSEVSFSRISLQLAQEIDLKNYIQFPVNLTLNSQFDCQSAISCAISGVAQSGVIRALNPNGLFSATINPIMLAKFGDGTFSTILYGQSGIECHSGFKAATATVFGPILIFQIMSFFTGHYYLNKMSNQFKCIDSKINKLLELHHLERIAKLKNAERCLNKFKKLASPNSEDMVLLKIIENDTANIYEEYSELISNLDLERIFATTKWTAANKIEEFVSKIKNEPIEFYLTMTINSDEILHHIKLIELIMNSRMNNNLDDRSKRICELITEIKTWKANDFYSKNSGATRVSAIYSHALKEVAELSDNANRLVLFFQSDKFKSQFDKLKKEKMVISEFILAKIEVLDLGQKLVEYFSQKIEILYQTDEKFGDTMLFARTKTGTGR